jgi:hypothetical protein
MGLPDRGASQRSGNKSSIFFANGEIQAGALMTSFMMRWV